MTQILSPEYCEYILYSYGYCAFLYYCQADLQYIIPL